MFHVFSSKTNWSTQFLIDTDVTMSLWRQKFGRQFFWHGRLVDKSVSCCVDQMSVGKIVSSKWLNENQSHPIFPRSPLSPLAPWGPESPLSPLGPGKPSMPGKPVWPFSPCCPGIPGGPWKWVVKIKCWPCSWFSKNSNVNVMNKFSNLCHTSQDAHSSLPLKLDCFINQKHFLCINSLAYPNILWKGLIVLECDSLDK